MRKFLKKLRSFFVWLVSGLLIVAAIVMIVAATPLFGNKALIVRSGSMQPTLDVGSMVVVRPASSYRVGDVIAHRMVDNQQKIVTHRVIEVVDEGEFVTQGDANEERDGYTVVQNQIIGRSVGHIPYIGSFFALAKTKAGFLGFVLGPVAVVILIELRVIFRELRGKPHKIETHVIVETKYIPSVKEEGESLPRFVFGSSLETTFDSLSRRTAVLILALGVMMPSAWAHFSDSAMSSGNTFTTASDFGALPGDVVINELMWMGSVGNSADEWVELRNMTSDPIDLSGWKLVGAGSGSDSIILSGSISGNGLYLLSNFATSSSAIADSITADQVTASLSLVNTGEVLELRKDTGLLIDETPAGLWAAGSDDAEHQSMQRFGATWSTCVDSACNDGVYWDVADGDNFGTPRASNI